ncbi:MAG TPA: hypothetical protein VGG64_29205 [Pirellulales bacterium]|jgi:hypothetical protein
MSVPILTVTLNEPREAYQPGDTLSGTYQVHAPPGGESQALEISVLWTTEGKGDEDMAVHSFERATVDETGQIAFLGPRQFSTVLPNSPLTYDGVIVKIRWCVRLRVFLARGKQLVEECPFRLGTIPAARAVLP